jgi:hypothetical protein
MKKFIEQATANWDTLNKGERALAKAAVNAHEEGLCAPALGLGMGAIWDDEIAEIIAAAEAWHIDTVFYAGGQSDSLKTLGLFAEAGADIGSLQKLTLTSETLAIVDHEMKMVAKTVWAVELHIA